MENMDKGLTVPKWVLIVQPKIPQMPQNLSAQLVSPTLKILNFNEKGLDWASVVCAPTGLSPDFQLFMNGWHFNNYV